MKRDVSQRRTLGTSRPSREAVLDAFRACAAKLGRTPGRGVFEAMSGIGNHHVTYYWPRQADMAKEAGLDSNELNRAVSDDEVFTDYAAVCLQLGKIPTSAELRIAARQLGTRSHNTFLKFGSLGELDRRFGAWLQGNGQPQHQAILTFNGWRTSSVPKTLKHAPALDAAIRPFLPAGLLHLDTLSWGNNPAPGVVTNVPHEFEQRCGDAFRCLGFDVQQLGQGRGRRADFVALARSDGFGVICDAKSRREGYALGTEDRKFLEYANRHTDELQRGGLRNVYLAVIGPKFRDADLAKLTKYLTDSPIRSAALIEARGLMRIVEDSIEHRHTFRLADVQQALFGNRVIS